MILTKIAAVDGWLTSLGMSHHQTTFENHGVDDFLVLPYLRLNILEDMGISPVDRAVIMRSVKQLQDLSEPHCKIADSFVLDLKHCFSYYVCSRRSMASISRFGLVRRSIQKARGRPPYYSATQGKRFCAHGFQPNSCRLIFPCH